MPHWIVSGIRLLKSQRSSLCSCELASTSSALRRDRGQRFWWASRMGNEMGSDSGKLLVFTATPVVGLRMSDWN